MVKVDVDPELAVIIEEMRKDPMTDKAIRNYARAFISTGDTDWSKKYKERY